MLTIESTGAITLIVSPAVTSRTSGFNSEAEPSVTSESGTDAVVAVLAQKVLVDENTAIVAPVGTVIDLATKGANMRTLLLSDRGTAKIPYPSRTGSEVMDRI